jgi:two-component system phosphate regulon sensor histidine kinase PhoR
MLMLVLSCVVIVAGVATILLAAERARRVSSLKSEFVANVSHELKTPLALVRMFGEMLQSGRVASEEKRQEYLSIIVRESERLSNLIENVLDFARVERSGRAAYQLTEGDVGQAVAKAANVYRYRAERDAVKLVVEIAPNLPLARIDERAIQLAVINLVDNALKYAPNGDVTVRATEERGDIVVRVVDKGPGVPPEERQRVFERFVRGSHAAGDTRVRGSGIGLALVKHIAESHGGEAWVEGNDGAGATFAFTVPGLRTRARAASSGELFTREIEGDLPSTRAIPARPGPGAPRE